MNKIMNRNKSCSDVETLQNSGNTLSLVINILRFFSQFQSFIERSFMNWKVFVYGLIMEALLRYR